MCRKVSGAPFMGFVEVADGAIEWTRGQPGAYQSSSGVVRRFCSTCGGALTFESDGIIFVTLGSLDVPEKVVFDCHTYTNSKLPEIELADGLPHFPGPAGGKGGRPIE